jgi:peptide/nickel transport system permease protein
MLRYIVRRVLWGIAMLFIVSAVIFLIFYVFPSADPAKLRAGRNASPDTIQAIRKELHLNDPIYVQYKNFMFGADSHIDVNGDFPFVHIYLHGDATGGVFTPQFSFGQSYYSQAPVKEIIYDRLPATALLVAGAVVFWLLMGLPVGIISAIKRRSILDRTTMVTSLAFISAPVFWLGLVALYLFADDVGKIHIFPGIGSYLAADSFWAKCWSLFLPWLVLAAASAAIYARYLRSSMIDVMSEDYIRTARAKGLPERRVIMRHGVRSAITPIVTLLGLDIGLLLAGNAILTESVFNIPGIGRQIVTSIRTSDLPVIQGIVLFGAFFIITANLIVDIAYAYLDPRVRYQ